MPGWRREVFESGSMGLISRFRKRGPSRGFVFGNGGVRASMRTAMISIDLPSASGDGTSTVGGIADGRVLGLATGVWSSRDNAEGLRLLGRIGVHAELSNVLMLGGMFQFGSVAGDQSVGIGEIRGRVWMAGPYFVGNGTSGWLRFEGRSLYGRSSNEIEAFSTGSGRFLTGSGHAALWGIEFADSSV